MHNLGGKGGLLSVETEYSVTTLLKALEENKQNHITEYAEAKKLYDASVLKLRSNYTKIAKKVPKDISDTETFENYLLKVSEARQDLYRLRPPVDAVKMYDDYIRNLSATATEKGTIKLTFEQANALINDQWDWAVEAKASNAFYLSTGSANR